MKATGQLTFTRHPDGTVTHEWTGGRRVEVTCELLETLSVPTGMWHSRLGRKVYCSGGIVFRAGDLWLRTVAMAFAPHGQAYRASIIAMEEGPLACLMAWWAVTAAILISYTERLDCWLYKGKSIRDVQMFDFPKRSLTGLLSKFI